MKKVIVASTNPVKLNSVQQAFERLFPEEEFEFHGISVDSQVGHQPMSNAETLQGATNRANNAKLAEPQADYWVGIEGGVEETSQAMETFAWIVVMSNNRTGKAKTGTFNLPNQVAELIRNGKELGEADDIVFGRSNSKQKNGAVGLFTRNAITRTSYYAIAVMLALIPFRNPELF